MQKKKQKKQATTKLQKVIKGNSTHFQKKFLYILTNKLNFFINKIVKK